MRHRKSGRKLGRKVAHRKALMSNLAMALISNKKIKTTDPKAKEVRSFIEPLITRAKKGDVHSRRQILKYISHKPTVRELFNVIAPNFSERNGGYTRITKLGFRDNDCAPMSRIEFVDMVNDIVPESKSEK